MPNTPSFTRRQALATLAAGAVAARHAFSEAKPLFRYSMLDHLAIAVDDTENSVRFYTRVFGNEVLKEKNGQRHYVKLGPNYIAMAPPAAGEKSQIVHHVCPGIVGFDHAATKHALDQLGLKYRESPTVGFLSATPTPPKYNCGPKIPGRRPCARRSRPTFSRRVSRSSAPRPSTTPSSTCQTWRIRSRFTRRFWAPSLIPPAVPAEHGSAEAARTALRWRWLAPARSWVSITSA